MKAFILITFLVLLHANQVCANDKIPIVSKGNIERINSFQSEYVRTRYLDIWLPPGYSNKQKYDVLYMHDGRMLFDANITWNKQEWQVDETAGQLIEQDKVRPFIIVAIPNAGVDRHSEFYPQQPFLALSQEVQHDMYQLERSPGTPLFDSKVYSDNYLKFIVTEVIPFVEATYSVNKGGNNRYLAGSSMGGLISWYGLMQYPNEFAGAICMSTHWPGAFAKDKSAFNAFSDYIKNNVTKLTTQKIYFDHGDQTLDAMYPELQKEIDTLFKQSKLPAQQWRSLFFAGENHSEKSWAKRLNIPLEFMFAKQK